MINVMTMMTINFAYGLWNKVDQSNLTAGDTEEITVLKAKVKSTNDEDATIYSLPHAAQS